MYQSKGVVAIIVLLNLFQRYNVNAEIKSIKQSYFYPQKQVMYNNYGMKDGIFVYAVCEELGPAKEKICTIIQRLPPYDQITHACNVTLQMKHSENVILTDRVWVHAFGQDNAILFWAETGPRTTFNLMAIQLNSCKMSSLELDDPKQSIYYQQIFNHKLLTYNNNFDMYVEAPKRTENSTGTTVGMRFELGNELQLIHNITKRTEESYVITFISPIASRSPDKGFVYSAFKEDATNTLTLVKPNGTEMVLMSHGPSSIYPIMTSANYDMITTCLKSETDLNIVCTQFNENGEIQFRVALDQDELPTYGIATVHTTPRGGFLLVTGMYDESGEQNHPKINRFRVLRVNSKGASMGSLVLNGFEEVKRGSNNIFSIWENGDDEFCATFVSQVATQTGNLHIVVDCFSENEFSD